jgi:hypothetical protein
MSSDRIANDYYPTPANLVTPLLDRLQLKGKILEPCAGDGAIARLIPGCLSNELYPKDFTPDWQLDASRPESWLEFGAINWTITNPPYDAKLLLKIITLALKHSRVGVAMLLRLSFLEPCQKVANRRELLIQYADCMTDLIAVNPRPKFRPDIKGTDNSTVAWFVWQKDFSWSRLGLRSPFGFLTDWKDEDEAPTIQPKQNRPEPAISDRGGTHSEANRLLMAIGAEEFLDYMLRGGEYSALDERAIALASNLEAHRDELEAEGIHLAYGDSPTHAIGSLLRWHRYKVIGRQKSVNGERIWIYRISTDAQRFCEPAAIASLGGSESEISPIEEIIPAQRFCAEEKACEGRTSNPTLQAGDRAERHLEGELGMAIEIIEVLPDGQFLCIDMAGRWRSPKVYRREELQPKGTYELI